MRRLVARVSGIPMRDYRLLVCLLITASLSFAQRVEIRAAPTVKMPAQVDSNSPAFWRGDTLYLINSIGSSMISHGGSQFSLSTPQPVRIAPGGHSPMWIEAVWQDPGGPLYAWYHHEPAGLCPNSNLTAPEIGALVSTDGGSSFTDLGIILSAPDPIDCSARNGFFGGGHGDFSVIPDREGSYLYFLFDNYGGDVSTQGVAIARMSIDYRANPAGAVWKYYDGGWTEPGLGGRLTPIFPAAAAWQRADANSFWGPSIHWNSYLESYVILMSHSCCSPNWPQEGIYVTFNPDLANPSGWSPPGKILGKVSYDAGYYPQVLGINSGETDTLAGPIARLYVHGRSDWEILFWKDTPPPYTDPSPNPGLDQDPIFLNSIPPRSSEKGPAPARNRPLYRTTSKP
ncbi:MAG: hypothetical protein IANPNBLG_01576 [Bryobacteraceae bacterium]|nr:hypothetical protein [Bryobacteraceae bacterium]